MRPPTFELVERAAPPHPMLFGIRCLVCGLTSWNPSDRAARYCGRCHRFHEAAGADPDAIRGVQMLEENRRHNAAARRLLALQALGGLFAVVVALLLLLAPGGPLR